MEDIWLFKKVGYVAAFQSMVEVSIEKEKIVGTSGEWRTHFL